MKDLRKTKRKADNIYYIIKGVSNKNLTFNKVMEVIQEGKFRADLTPDG